MYILSARGSILKQRSLSMPGLHTQAVLQPIHKIKRSKQKLLDIGKGDQKILPVISLRGIKDKQEQELNSKIKVISQRNLKKLEEKYQTIDRWKHKYIPDSSVLLLKIRSKADESASEIQPLSQPLPLQPKIQISASVSPSSQKILPLLQNPVLSQIPDKKNQRSKLQAELKARLERNKRYYQVQNQIEKQINYFQQCNDRVTPEKKRQYELKKIFANLSQQNRLNSFCYQKISLQSHPAQVKLESKQLRKRQSIQQPNQLAYLQPQTEIQYHTLVKRSKSINQLRQKLMEQAAEAIPEGWASSLAEEDQLQQ